jgi:hypothetical protein
MNIFVIPIEPIDQRYTKQWYENIPLLIQKETDKFGVITVDGTEVADVTTKGAFLDFALTNAYKASQIERVSRLFSENKIKPGDRFLFTDAWHFGIPAIKYMSQLLNIPVEIHGIWHAGAYDPTDILGMKMSKDWVYNFERSLYFALDYSYFATDFHMNMFLKNLTIAVESTKTLRSGQPHTLIIKPLLDMSTAKKNDTVMFPHRLNSDKQPQIAKTMSEVFSVNITQTQNLSKEKYYKQLSSSKIIFSCALHENLGISIMEGCLAGCIPVVPDRASYSEMYLDVFKYPSEWTKSYFNYMCYQEELHNFIRYKIDNYSRYYGDLMLQRNILIDKYLTPTVMIENLTR